MEHEKLTRLEKTRTLLAKQRKPSRHRVSKRDYMDPRWLELRLKALDRDGWKCPSCKSTEDLNVHHVRYVPRGRIWDSPLKDLVTLCKSCHKSVHDILSGRTDVDKKKKKKNRRK